MIDKNTTNITNINTANANRHVEYDIEDYDIYYPFVIDPDNKVTISTGVTDTTIGNGDDNMTNEYKNYKEDKSKHAIKYHMEEDEVLQIGSIVIHNNGEDITIPIIDADIVINNISPYSIDILYKDNENEDNPDIEKLISLIYPEQTKSWFFNKQVKKIVYSLLQDYLNRTTIEDVIDLFIDLLRWADEEYDMSEWWYKRNALLISLLQMLKQEVPIEVKIHDISMKKE